VRALVIAALLVCTARGASADSTTWWRAGGEGAVVVATEVPLKPLLAPKACRWCDPDDLDDAAARAAVWGSHLTLADRLSYATLALDLGVVGWDRQHDLAPVAESIAATALVTQAIKFTVGRERPFVHYNLRRLFIHDDDDDVSFCSGHTAIAFAAATAARSPTGFVLAGLTAYLRMGAGKHYLTDVLAGAAVGVGIGALVSHFDDRSPQPASPSVVLLSGVW
jgi:membrane-associated phospholipid phosphatase